MDALTQSIKYLINSRVKSPADLERLKKIIAEKYKISTPLNSELLEAYHNLLSNKRIKQNKILEDILKKRRVRSLSGIVVVSVLTKAYPCPGKCLYCPEQKGIPKSYLDKEPAVMRAILTKFDPYMQVKSRIKALEANGHPTDKVDLRIIGATWSYYPKNYQNWFIKKCFEAANGRKNSSLGKLQKTNEKAKHRIIGITIETRPDYITEEEIKRLRELGVTMVELGVQSVYDDVLKLNRRGHLISETIKATKMLKNAGFKVCYQMMPNMAGSSLKKDEKMFEQIFYNSDFCPDMIKIYPLNVLKEAPIYKKIKQLKYKPYTENQLKKLIKSIKKITPYYVRIQRIIRDIPSSKIILGANRISNLRQVILKEAEKEGWKCKCIRCREVKENYNPKERLYLFREDYKSSDGNEIFLTYENKNRQKLYSLLRLRILCENNIIFPALKNAAIIREVHTYGQLHSFNCKEKKSPQHKGLGKKLMKKAEKIAKKEFKLNKIAVISGVGVRDYYRKMGYKLKETYMVKNL
jgi:elongator complex protein 3